MTLSTLVMDNHQSKFSKSLLSAACLVAVLGLSACGGSSDKKEETPPTTNTDVPSKTPPKATVAADKLNTKIQIEEVAVTIPDGAILLDKDNLAESAAKAFAKIKDGDVIVFPEGYYKLPSQIKVAGNPLGGNLQNIKIFGMGHNKTVLDFSGLEKGSKGEAKGVDGLLLSDIENLEIAHLTVVEAGKNAIKVENIDGLHMHHVATIWDGALTKENGAYGIYPVNSKNVLVEDTFTRGSADAGVYVGQSKHVIVRNSVAIENVAGMEIENCEDAEFYGNTAEKNTGGLLVFDLPIGSGKYGDNVRVFNNTVKGNNTENFAVVSDFAGGVHVVPPGTGIIILSTSNVEIYDNKIHDHKTAAIAITDYAFAEEPEHIIANQQKAVADGWSPNVKEITVHDNVIDKAGYDPDKKKVGPILQVIKSVNGNKDELADMTYVGIGQSLSTHTAAMNQALLGAAALAEEPAKTGLTQAAAAALVSPYNTSFPENNVCFSNNKNSDGDMASYNVVFDPAIVASRFGATEQQAFVGSVGAALQSTLTEAEQADAIANKGEKTEAEAIQAATMAKIQGAITQVIVGQLGGVGGNPAPNVAQPQACTKPALDHTKVTIGGKEYGCGFDDDNC